MSKNKSFKENVIDIFIWSSIIFNILGIIISFVSAIYGDPTSVFNSQLFLIIIVLYYLFLGYNLIMFIYILAKRLNKEYKNLAIINLIPILFNYSTWYLFALGFSNRLIVTGFITVFSFLYALYTLWKE